MEDDDRSCRQRDRERLRFDSVGLTGKLQVQCGSTGKNRDSTSLRRGGRAADCTGLENRHGESHRGFESLPLRSLSPRPRRTKPPVGADTVILPMKVARLVVDRSTLVQSFAAVAAGPRAHSAYQRHRGPLSRLQVRRQQQGLPARTVHSSCVLRKQLLPPLPSAA